MRGSGFLCKRSQGIAEGSAGKSATGWVGVTAVPVCSGPPLLVLHLSWPCHGQGEHLAQALSSQPQREAS